MKHSPMESCKDYLAKPKRRYEGFVAQCCICGNKFIGSFDSWGNACWELCIEGEQE